MMQNTNEFIERIKRAYRNHELSLYVGAGISVGNGLPTWEQLVLAMYYSKLTELSVEKELRPYPNYLFAIAEWHLGRYHEPLEITARKIRNGYETPEQFLTSLKNTLYAGFRLPDEDYVQTPDISLMLDTNLTLGAIRKLCQPNEFGRSKIRSVVTYNYDDLLEMAVGSAHIHVQPIWKDAQGALSSESLLVYHIHGFIPINGEGSTAQEIVFTEEQYHLESQNPYSWSNLVQIQTMSSSVGLMIGLSLTDRNMRGLLDAVRKTPTKSENYALIQKPRWKDPSDQELQGIDEKATDYFDRFEKSGIKTYTRRFTEIQKIIDRVEEFDMEIQESVLMELGVYPIWYEEHDDIPGIIDRVIYN